MHWIKKLKQRWDVQSTLRIIIILVVFSITGMTVIAIKPFIIELVFQSRELSDWKIALYYLLSPIIYNILLLSYGALLGQFYFFWKFEKKLFRRIQSLFKKKSRSLKK